MKDGGDFAGVEGNDYCCRSELALKYSARRGEDGDWRVCCRRHSANDKA